MVVGPKCWKIHGFCIMLGKRHQMLLLRVNLGFCLFRMNPPKKKFFSFLVSLELPMDGYGRAKQVHYEMDNIMPFINHKKTRKDSTYLCTLNVLVNSSLVQISLYHSLFIQIISHF